MDKPNLGQLAQLAEIVAAAAVVISLIYVGLQVQDNTAAIRSSTMQAVADSSDLSLALQASDGETLQIKMTGDFNLSALDDLERGRYLSFYRGTWIRFQNIWAQQRLGVLDPTFWGTYSKIICSIYAPPGVQETWDFHAAVLDPEFVEFVESCDRQARKSE